MHFEPLENRCLLAAGSLDSTFAAGAGYAVTPFGASTDEARSVALQSDGKIVAAGYTFDGNDIDFALTRYNTDGTLDTTFDGDGKLTTDFAGNDDTARSVFVQAGPSGKILVAGSTFNGTDYDFALARYNSDGTLDATFGAGGKVVTPVGSGDDEARGLTVQADGQIVVAGYSSNGADKDFALVRYNVNGTPDATFGSGGKVVTPLGPGNDTAAGVVVQADGKIVAAGSSANGTDDDFAVVRYDTFGNPDPMFGSGGKVITPVGSLDDVALGLALAPDGKIVVAGASATVSVVNYDMAVVRYDTSGGLDSTFDGDGKVVTPIGSGNDLAQSVVVQADGKIVVAGSSIVGEDNDLALVRYTTSGGLDNTFDGDGKVTTPIGASHDFAYDLTLQADGKIVVAGSTFMDGSFDFVVARYESGPLEGPRVAQVLVDSSLWKPAFYTTLIATTLGTQAGYKVPAGANQVKTIWFNTINRIALTFSEDVDVQQGDLTIAGVNVPSYSFSGFSYSSATRTAVWTLSNSIVNDNLTLYLDGSSPAAAKGLGGTKLDGEWTNYATPYPSGNGSAGGDFSFRLNVLSADVNQDNIVDVSDIQAIAAHYLEAFPRADINGSNLVDISEIQAVAINYLHTGGGAGGPAGASEPAAGGGSGAGAGAASASSSLPRQAAESVDPTPRVDATTAPMLSQDLAPMPIESGVETAAARAVHSPSPLARVFPATNIQGSVLNDGPINSAAINSLTGGAQTPATDAAFAVRLNTQHNTQLDVIDGLRSRTEPVGTAHVADPMLFDEAILAFVDDSAVRKRR
ncbi:MAG: hypothetical protein HYX69_18450 [Planctomycetia bacterium]|nr:hypothetical protein [Planctomycetia bacterium]